MTQRIHAWSARRLRRLRPRLVVLLGVLLAPLRARHREAGMTTAEYAVGTGYSLAQGWHVGRH